MEPRFKDRQGIEYFINPRHVVKLKAFDGHQFGECTVIYHDTSDGEGAMFTTVVVEPMSEVWKKLFGK